MVDLQSSQAKVCFTSAGCLIHEGKVLLVKHKKLGIWLNPGGHLEENELPHQNAEREFLEETGVKVRAVSGIPLPNDPESEFVPSPFLTNLHWISPENYEARVKGSAVSADTKQKWGGRGCEQHLSFLYLVKPVKDVEFKQDETETDDIGWFAESELDALNLKSNIKYELQTAFAISKHL